jgi:flagellar biosynthesis/type III secretory pathway chaperone
MDHSTGNSTYTGEINKEIQNLYDDLIRALKQEIGAYEKLCNSFQAEKEVLMKSSMEDLIEHNVTKEACVRDVRMLDEERAARADKIAEILDIKGDTVPLSTLIAYADDGRKTELEECRSELSLLAGTAQRMNEHNKLLLEFCLQHVKQSFELISDLLTPCPTYMQTGMMNGNNCQGHIISKVG